MMRRAVFAILFNNGHKLLHRLECDVGRLDTGVIGTICLPFKPSFPATPQVDRMVKKRGMISETASVEEDYSEMRLTCISRSSHPRSGLLHDTKVE